MIVVNILIDSDNTGMKLENVNEYLGGGLSISILNTQNIAKRVALFGVIHALVGSMV